MASFRVGAFFLLALGSGFGCAPSEAEFDPVGSDPSVIPQPDPDPKPQPEPEPANGGSTSTGGSGSSGGSSGSASGGQDPDDDDMPSAGQPGTDPPDEPDPPLDPCSNVSCAAGSHCEAGKCVPDVVVDPCALVSCPSGSHCAAGECLPDQRVTCGGIAGIACPGAGKCLDDPSDDCDPEAGGADCGGVCVCAVVGICKQGQHWDGSPHVCACVNGNAAGSCGGAKCGPDEYCCNASCGICAAEGESCLDIACL